jgi:hypothetical protein
MNPFSIFPDQMALLERYRQHRSDNTLKVNSHIHTPYSFSAFGDMDTIFTTAREENIAVLGINDFYTTAGYDEFLNLAMKSGIFPMLNIELIGLLEREQQQNIRINDPNNPGRIYCCGKGLQYPFSLSPENTLRLQHVIDAGRKQVVAMISILNEKLEDIAAPFTISYDTIKKELARELVRERHVAKMLRIRINDHFSKENEKSKFLYHLYSGRHSEVDMKNYAALEEELRGRLLKSGGIAFVAEDPEAFLPLHAIIEIIKDAGGIPCYPVLLDDNKGKFTEFEQDFNQLSLSLQDLDIGMIELIPGRNDIAVLRHFVNFFHEKGFAVVFGTEHNTPLMIPLTVTARNNTIPDDGLLDISLQGCCIVAAHQYLVSKGFKRPADTIRKISRQERAGLIELGRAVIDYFINR